MNFPSKCLDDQLQKLRVIWPSCGCHQIAVLNTGILFPNSTCKCGAQAINKYQQQWKKAYCLSILSSTVLNPTMSSSQQQYAQPNQHSGHEGSSEEESALKFQHVKGWQRFSPAAITTGFTGANPVHSSPLRTSAAASTNGPWQMDATRRFESTNFFTKCKTDSSAERYSGARPPGITKAS